MNRVAAGRMWNACIVVVVVASLGTQLVLVIRVNLSGVAKLTDIGTHYIVPVAAVIGWLLFGPRPRIDYSTLLPSCIYPAVYMVYTLIHGASSKWYPYPFADVVTLGHPVAA
jgi:hypothetical protein